MPLLRQNRLGIQGSGRCKTVAVNHKRGRHILHDVSRVSSRQPERFEGSAADGEICYFSFSK